MRSIEYAREVVAERGVVEVAVRVKKQLRPGGYSSMSRRGKSGEPPGTALPGELDPQREDSAQLRASGSGQPSWPEMRLPTVGMAGKTSTAIWRRQSARLNRIVSTRAAACGSLANRNGCVWST